MEVIAKIPPFIKIYRFFAKKKARFLERCMLFRNLAFIWLEVLFWLSVDVEDLGHSLAALLQCLVILRRKLLS